MQHHYEGHSKGWTLKIETFLGPELARAKRVPFQGPAKMLLLAGGALVPAGGPAANSCSETASTIWFATKSTIRLKCFKKSAPKMAKLTLARRKVHSKQRPENSTASFFSPQQGIASPLGLLRDGPEPGSDERCGKMLKEAAVSTKKQRSVMLSVRWSSSPGTTPFSCPCHCRFPASCRAAHRKRQPPRTSSV